MIMRHQKRSIIAVILALITLAAAISAQTEDTATLKAQGKILVESQRFTEALPLYEKLAKLAPKDPEVLRNLGFSLLGQAATIENEQAKRQLRVRARESFIKAKDLGDNSLLVKGLIDGLPPDGSGGQGFSDNAEANKAMQKAEALFASGKLDEAFNAYQEALALDPRCYYAALFSGDVMTQTKRYDEAEKWYQRAISIDPFIETAYRYSATPLMRQGKYDQARDCYIESFIVAPYDRLAMSGIVQWAEATKTQLGHPKIDIPKTTVGPDGKEKTTITVNPGVEDGSTAWIAYSATRETWKKGKFAKTFPNESVYRHSLVEEADALRSVVSMAKSLKPTTLNSQIAMIEKLDREGLLEAYILMAIPDRGIAQDHPVYLRSNRDRLRRYVLRYVIGQKNEA
jgi:tetratricopeptide (TPR) repeat protein